MKIAIDTSILKTGHAARGIGSYTRNLLTALKQAGSNHKFVEMGESQQSQVDLIHYPYFDFFFLTLPYLQNVPFVVTVHDVIPLRYPAFYPPGIRGNVKFVIQKTLLKRARAIITDSDASKDDVVRYLGIPKDKVHRVYLAANTDIQAIDSEPTRKILTKYHLIQPYFLYVGDINYNKNIPGLLHAFSQLESPHELVLVTRAMKTDVPEASSIRQLIQELDLAKQVKILANVESNEDLSGLYSGADCYVQPSFYEGFGLPVLDAMQCKTPVVSSNGGSLQEVVGDAGVVFDPMDERSFVHALKTAASMSQKEKGLWIEKGLDNVRRFSWQKTAAESIAMYEKVMQ